MAAAPATAAKAQDTPTRCGMCLTALWNGVRIRLGWVSGVAMCANCASQRGEYPFKDPIAEPETSEPPKKAEPIAAATAASTAAPASEDATKDKKTPEPTTPAAAKAAAVAPPPVKETNAADTAKDIAEKLAKLAAMQRDVRKMAHGCWKQGRVMVHSTKTPPDEGKIQFVYSYTIGMPRLCGTGEFVIANMYWEYARNLLLSMQLRIKEKKLVPKDGETYPPGLISTVMGFKLREFKEDGERAALHAVGSDVAKKKLSKLPGYGTVYQILWPDEKGSYAHNDKTLL